MTTTEVIGAVVVGAALALARVPGREVFAVLFALALVDTLDDLRDEVARCATAIEQLHEKK